MKNRFEGHPHKLRKKNFMISLLIGSLTGAGIMLLFAPQSGRQTRANLYPRSILMGNRAQINHMPSTFKTAKVPVKVTPSIMSPVFLPMDNRSSTIRRSSLLPKTEGQLLTEELLANDSLGG